MWAWQQKRPRAIFWCKTAIFIKNGWSDFYELLKVDSLTSNRCTAALTSIKYHLKYIVIFGPPQTPLRDLVFRAALSHFLANFKKKKGVKMLSGSYCNI